MAAWVDTSPDLSSARHTMAWRSRFATPGVLGSGLTPMSSGVICTILNQISSSAALDRRLVDRDIGGAIRESNLRPLASTAEARSGRDARAYWCRNDAAPAVVCRCWP